MGWKEFEQSVREISLILYRLGETDLVRAEAELKRLLRLAAHYRRVTRGESPDAESGSASHLCRTPPPMR